MDPLSIPPDHRFRALGKVQDVVLVERLADRSPTGAEYDVIIIQDGIFLNQCLKPAETAIYRPKGHSVYIRNHGPGILILRFAPG